MSLLDITKPIYIDFTNKEIKSFKCSQYDKDARKYKVCFLNNGVERPIISSEIVRIKFMKPDDNPVFNDCTNNTDGSITFTLTEQMCAASGDAKFQFTVYNSAKTEILNSMPLTMVIEKAVFSNDTVTSSYEFDALNTALGKVDKGYDSISEYVNQASASASAAKTSETNALTYKNNASTSATNAKTSESNALTYKNNASVSATNAASSASAAKTSETNAASSASTATSKASSASTSATNAKTSETNAKTSETNSKTSETNAKASEGVASSSASSASTSSLTATSAATSATTSASNAKTSETNAASSASTATTKATSASTSATKAESYAVGGTNTRTNEDIDNSKYYYEQVKNVAEGLKGTLIPSGTITFANLPSSPVIGAMYNISDQFTTTALFKEGAGNVIPAGANIYYTVDKYWDVLAGSPVTGIKGNSETTYRRGNVNITPTNIGLGNVPNVSTNNQVPTFTKATSLSAITSGETLTVNLGKIAYWYEAITAINTVLTCSTTDIDSLFE